MSWWVRDGVRSVYDENEVEPKEPHELAWAFGEKMHEEQGEARRAVADAALFFMYGSARSGLRGSSLASTVAPNDPPFRNVIRKCVNTKTAFIFRNKVRCFFLTDGANVEDQEKAQGMTRSVEAQFAASGIYGTLGYRICQDGQAFDGGCAQVITDVENNRVLIERVFPWEIYVPAEEARAGAPWQYGRRILIDRSGAAAMFPKFKKEIAEAPTAPDDWKVLDELSSAETSDLIAVWHLWHVPSGTVDLEKRESFGIDPKGKFNPKIDPGHDGRTTICIEKATLYDRPYPFEYPPLAFYLPQPDPLGFWSMSLPEMLQGIQMELIKLGKRIRSIIHLHAVPRLGVDRRAKVNTSKLTNDLADIVEMNGSPSAAMHYLQPGAVPAELFRREAELDDLAMQESGISEMSAFAQKPAGINHEPGMQHLADTESIRHTAAHRGWEEFHLQLGRSVVDAFRSLAEYNKDFSTLWGDDEELKLIKWNEVDLGRGKYMFRAFPTSLLPSTPGAKISRVLELAKGGALDDTPQAQRMRTLLDHPDTRAAFGDTNAIPRRIAKLLDEVERDGLTDKTMPSPYNDPALCMQMAKERINKREGDGVAEERVDNLRDFYDAARRVGLTMRAEEAAAEQGIAPGAAPPPAPPGAPGPQGNLPAAVAA